jgi:TorA maturation chaperone TorD
MTTNEVYSSENSAYTITSAVSETLDFAKATADTTPGVESNTDANPDAANTSNLAEAAVQESDDMTPEDLACLCDERAATYAFLARLYQQEVDQELYDQLMEAEFPKKSGNDLMDEGHYGLAFYLSNTWVDQLMKLSIDYSKSFLGSGIDTYSAAYPFESVYTSEKRLLMQDARDEVIAIYRSCGLEKAESWKVGEDHISAELEFMSIMATRAAKALRSNDEDRAFSCLNTQYNFMTDHLSTWVPVFTNEVRHFADTLFYQSVANITEGFLYEDEEFLRGLVTSEDE